MGYSKPLYTSSVSNRGVNNLHDLQPKISFLTSEMPISHSLLLLILWTRFQACFQGCSPVSSKCIALYLLNSKHDGECFFFVSVVNVNYIVVNVFFCILMKITKIKPTIFKECAFPCNPYGQFCYTCKGLITLGKGLIGAKWLINNYMIFLCKQRYNYRDTEIITQKPQLIISPQDGTRLPTDNKPPV
ncbi:hypothetical protein GDO81_013351 [Engystomops pustulosus]|uniref:Transmembrane protein n=1 Tax=Engystomops pustulosus TaxID=76066 RepID=A0AAV7B2H1_ENGPU|nr:hypothetical protein GDO81_013351 [Engystomops pustulosus]